jgi:hypothetical protein
MRLWVCSVRSQILERSARLVLLSIEVWFWSFSLSSGTMPQQFDVSGAASEVRRFIQSMRRLEMSRSNFLRKTFPPCPTHSFEPIRGPSQTRLRCLEISQDAGATQRARSHRGYVLRERSEKMNACSSSGAGTQRCSVADRDRMNPLT